MCARRLRCAYTAVPVLSGRPALRIGEREVQELIELGRLVVAKRGSRCEAVLAVERERRLEGRSRASLEADAHVAAGARELEQLLQQALGSPATQVTRGGPHRLDLAGRGVELFEGAAREEVAAVP